MSAVLYSSSDRIGVITLNRPEARNAVDREMALGLEAAVDRLEDDPEVWVGVLCANTAEQARPVFCAGADLKVVRETGSAATLDTERGGFGGFVYRERAKPIVVAVDGLATAGGLEIVLAADVVVATTRSAFGLAEVRHNLIAAAGGLFRLPRAIGRAAAMDAILTGEPIDARRAFDLGLVSRLVEPGAALDEALRVAQQIVAAAPLAVRASRRVVLLAAHEHDDTLRQVSQGAVRRAARVGGRERRAARLRREAPAAVAGSLMPAPRYRRSDGATQRATIPTQREVEGASRRDRRHLGAGLRATRLPRHRHRGAVRGQRLRQGRLLLLHRVEGGAPRRDPRPGDGRGDARRRSRRRAGGSPSAQLAMLGDELLDVIHRYPDHVWVFLHEFPALTAERAEQFRTRRREYERRVEAVLQAGIDAGEFRDVDPWLTARAWLGMHNYTYLWLKAGGRVSARDVAKPFADIFLRGIAGVRRRTTACSDRHRRLEPEEPTEGAADHGGLLVGGDAAGTAWRSARRLPRNVPSACG